MRLSRREQPDAAVSMSPMIDCVFLLLIFFLVATMFKKEDRDIDIVPPESSSAVKMPPDDEQVVIGLNELGEVYWMGEAVTKTRLHEELREVAEVNVERRIRVDAHFEAPFEYVVEVLDACQFRGLSNVGIRTYDDRYNRR